MNRKRMQLTVKLLRKRVGYIVSCLLRVSNKFINGHDAISDCPDLIEGVLYIILIDSHVIVALEYCCAHWHRLVQNIGGKRKCWGDGVARTDETIGISQ